MILHVFICSEAQWISEIWTFEIRTCRRLDFEQINLLLSPYRMDFGNVVIWISDFVPNLEALESA